MGLKINEFSALYQHDKWLKLYVSSEAIQSFITAPHITYKSYYKSTNQSNTLKQFAESGARNIDNNGPMQELKSLLYRYMQPWRPGEVLHVGLAPVHVLNSKIIYSQVESSEIPQVSTL